MPSRERTHKISFLDIKHYFLSLNLIVLFVATFLSIFSYIQTQEPYGFFALIYLSVIFVLSVGIRIIIFVLYRNEKNKTLIEYEHSEAQDSVDKYVVISFIVFAILLATYVLIFALKNYIDNYAYFIATNINRTLLIIPSGLILTINLNELLTFFSLKKVGIHYDDQFVTDALVRSDVIVIDGEEVFKTSNVKVEKVVSDSMDVNAARQIISSLLNEVGYEESLNPALYDYFMGSPSFGTVSTLPYSSKNGYSAVTFSTGMTYLLGEMANMDLEGKNRVYQKISEFESEGYRVLIAASGNNQVGKEEYKGKVKIVAYILLKEKIKSGVSQTFKWLNDNDIKVKILSSGDSAIISKLTKEAGFIDSDKCYENSADIVKYADTGALFCGLNQSQKELLIDHYRETNPSACVVKNSFDKLPILYEVGYRLNNVIKSLLSLYMIKSVVIALIAIAYVFIGVFTNNVYQNPLSFNSLIMWELVSTLGVSLFILLETNNKRFVKPNLLLSSFISSIPGIITIISGFSLCFVAYLLHTNGIIYTGVEDYGYIVNTSSVNKYGASAMSILVTISLSFTVVYSVIRQTYKKKHGLVIPLFIMCALIVVALIFNQQEYNGLHIDFNKLLPVNYLVVGAIVIIPSAILLISQSLYGTLKEKNQNDKN